MKRMVAGADMCAQQLGAKDLYGCMEHAVRSCEESYSSMHQDMDAHRQTEIRYLNGQVAKSGADLGVPVPTNSQLANAVSAKEHNFSGTEEKMCKAKLVTPALV